MQAIAIDVGYSATKAVTSSDRVLIPSVVAPFRELPISDLSRNGSGHMVSIHKLSADEAKHFVGDLAVREGSGATFTLEREKHRHPNHDVLVLTVARLLNVEPGASLAAGLPVAYYRSQKDELQRHLESLHAEVSVDGIRGKRVSFDRVIVYPQGAGALMTAPELPASGLVLLIDVGYKTTDFIAAEVAGGLARPVGALCGSVETGVHAVHMAIAAAYQERTGVPLPAVRLRETGNSDGRLFFYGKEVDLSDVVAKTKVDVAINIMDQVRAQLGDRAPFIGRAYLSGGGAHALPGLTSIFPVTRILPEAQWANAIGFLKVVGHL